MKKVDYKIIIGIYIYENKKYINLKNVTEGLL